MKRFIKIMLTAVVCALLAVSICAAPEDFVIENGILTDYTGNEAEVTIPEEVTSIATGAFSDSASVSKVTINSMTCSFEPGAFSAGVTVISPSGSAAEADAIRDGLTTKPIQTKYTLTIEYVYTDGETAAPTFTYQYNDGASYGIDSPELDGFICDRERVVGTVSGADIKVTVTYSKKTAAGWKLEYGTFKYFDGTRYLAGEKKEIDGIVRTFNPMGNLISSGDFLSYDGNMYYISGSHIVTGYRVIGNAVYCFRADGVMLTNTTKETDSGAHTFDINGMLIGDGLTIDIDGKTYLLSNNTLYSGFDITDTGIYYYGDDFAMVKGTTADGYTFDASGKLSAGVKDDDITTSPLPDVSHTGEEHKPKITVYFKELALTENVHYKLTYSNNIDPGAATVKIEGISPMKFSIKKNFTILGEKTYTLTIHYVNIGGMTMAPSFSTEVEPGGEFRIPSPTVDGYRPDIKEVAGTMGSSDVTIKVIYKKYNPNSDTSGPDTEEPDTTPSTTEKEPPETLKNEETRTSVTYNYSLLLKVFIISTVIVGGAIVLIINWDLIRKGTKKRKK